MQGSARVFQSIQKNAKMPENARESKGMQAYAEQARECVRMQE